MPTVVVVTERFQSLARSVARARRVPDFPMMVLPANIEEMPPEGLRTLADSAFPKIVQDLTHPPRPFA